MKQVRLKAALCAVAGVVTVGSVISPLEAGGPPPPWAKKWAPAPASGPLDVGSMPKNAVIVGDHWHLPNDFGAVLHGERWGRAGRLGAWKVPVQKVK